MIRLVGSWVIVFAMSGSLVACDSVDPSIPTASSAVSSPTPSPTPGVEPAPILTGPCCYGLALEPGTYTTPSWFEAGFSIDVSDGLLGVAGELERVILLGRGASRAGNLERYVGFFVAPSATALVRQLRATPRTTQGPVSTTMVDSMPAVEFEAKAQPSSETPPSDEIVPGAIRIPAIDRLVPTFFYTESVPARMRFVVADLGDRALLIYLEAPAARFTSFARALAPVLESIRFAS